MARSPLIKYCDQNRISDGLLREFIHKELWGAASDEVGSVISKLEKQIDALKQLRIAIEAVKTANKGEQSKGEQNEQKGSD